MEARVKFRSYNEIPNPFEDMVPPKSEKAVEDVRTRHKIWLVPWQICPERLIYRVEVEFLCLKSICCHVIRVHLMTDLGNASQYPFFSSTRAWN
jgi:hypothetical protein